MSKVLSYKQFGERAVLIEWEAKISHEILKDITSFRNIIYITLKERIEDCIVGYHSLTVVFKQLIIFSTEEELLKNLYNKQYTSQKNINYLWKIPVCYTTQFGSDLEELSLKLNLSVKEIINLHSSVIYTVYFIGFLPGFLYLGGLDKRLHFPRKSTPRLQVAKGSLAIGGSQTGVYPQESAGGWNIIGNTPISFFNLEEVQPCFAKSGDKIQFIPVSLDQYNNVLTEVNKSNYQLLKQPLND